LPQRGAKLALDPIPRIAALAGSFSTLSGMSAAQEFGSVRVSFPVQQADVRPHVTEQGEKIALTKEERLTPS